jgi:hypothetical protein
MPGPSLLPPALVTIPKYASAFPKPPPKPVAKQPTATDVYTVTQAPTLPHDVTQAWRLFWHELGSNLPWYINHCRASRKALRQAAVSHGR